ncbi:unnamed protein product [Dovyalis caffra]|uniref:Peptidase A1 domain-containing protein n=1 Tax=Dovyalis caffra TaxID=77055 RepID=A0AAV1RX72_9ROSI|nr:unnamed protein product [Dovyalis caffra]
MVLKLQHKFAGRIRNLTEFKAHDARRHSRLLSSIDLPIGGNGHPSETGLYFAKIGLGNPSKDYYVQVDTGSDILWVNCIDCNKCPTKSELELPCQYNVVYGDGSSTAGYFVKDNLQFERVTGNQQTALSNGTVIFGCGAQQSGELGSTGEALDGILGFGQANSSVISQLASAGKVGGTVLELPTDVFDSGDRRGTIIDSGTTLVYLPEVVYDSLMNEIRSQQPGLSLHTVEEQFICFQYTGNVDDGFPVVKFHFKDSLALPVYPHDYLFEIKENIWCFGWQNSGIQSKDGRDMTLLGDLVLSNKLVLYDIEKQAIGWTEYNCSSSIKVKDDNSGSVYSVGAENLSSASKQLSGRINVCWV